MTQARNELVTVYLAMGRLQAEVIRSRLNAEGIPSILTYESVGQVYGLTVDGLGQVAVQVPQRFAELAKTIIGE